MRKWLEKKKLKQFLNELRGHKVRYHIAGDVLSEQKA